MPSPFQDPFTRSVDMEFSPRKDAIDGTPVLGATFWASSQRQGHPLHEISYRACFKPELPRFLIGRLSRPGEAVLDPFMGRGTTVLEAALLGRVPVGNDVNPLSTLLARPRLAPPLLADVEAWLARMDWRAAAQDTLEAEALGLDAFYHVSTLEAVCALRRTLAEAAPLSDTAPDRAADWVRMVALNRLTGHSPGFFSGRTMPPNQAVSVASQRRINERLGVLPPPRDVPLLILRKSRSLLRQGVPPMPGAVLLTGPAGGMSALADGSVSLVVTSPPFLDIVQYADDNWLRCWFAGISASEVPIGMHRTLPAWEGMMTAAIVEMHRVLSPGGHACVEVGEVRKGTVRLEEAVLRAAAGTGMEPVVVLVNEGAFTKTASLWGVSNNRAGTNTNRIVVLRKP